jgi:phosphoribosylpyrophosphate synthetase
MDNSNFCDSKFKNIYEFQIPDYRNAVIVARNPGSAKKATSYAERLRLGIAVIHGEQKVILFVLHLLQSI